MYQQLKEEAQEEKGKLYVAGKWGNKEKINKVIKELVKKGYTITHNWTKVEGQEYDKTSKEQTLKHNRCCASLDVDAVKEADCVLAIMDDPDYAYRGTFCEIGVALGQEKKIIVYCPHEKAQCKTNCFFHHPSIEHYSDLNEAVTHLDEFTRPRNLWDWLWSLIPESFTFY